MQSGGSMRAKHWGPSTASFSAQDGECKVSQGQRGACASMPTAYVQHRLSLNCSTHMLLLHVQLSQANSVLNRWTNKELHDLEYRECLSKEGNTSICSWNPRCHSSSIAHNKCTRKEARSSLLPLAPSQTAASKP